MNDIIMYCSALISVIVVIIMLIKKMDIKITLFAMGIVLMYIAIATGNTIAISEFKSTGLILLDPIKAVINQFESTLPAAGFIILILGGYSTYMTSIGANEVTVHTLTKPIKRIKSVYILVPLVFLIGNLLSLVIPSASNLAIILLATLYPVLRQAGMTPITAAAVIATTATVMPTPLGGDNVAIATELAKYPQFAGLSVTDYVIHYHAIVSIPTLIIMAIAHFFWQKFMDKKNGKVNSKEENIELKEIKSIQEGILYRFVYTILPIFPILLLIIVYIIRSTSGKNIDISVSVASLISFIIAIICECIRTKDINKTLKQTENFFKGMGNSLPIVALLVAASVFVLGLNSIGLIQALQKAMLGIHGSGLGFVLPLILMGLTIIIVLLSGSGTALFYAMIPLVVPLATAAGISPIAISIPMGLCGNLMRAVSPVAAVVVIVAGTIKVNPLDIVKRTSVPMIAGVITMFTLSIILFV
ncbi:C4-dicarboxylate transporter DcuC [Clostridium uliginosum]|uniref:C4-dicarboxylate transporter, DcuC family n=1 Tax=Clostridium uliginosum TaxID=119641 RepID=A0A1I1RS95_9CLOT|nr:C4-dicarboxylate transporter DcuC [Clostridium uliginosum]SFD37226.1 C4-dicarboxylate transporter, DcuC family [Clostridium uliginosum]